MKALRNIFELHFQQLIIYTVSHAILIIPENINVVWYLAHFSFVLFHQSKQHNWGSKSFLNVGKLLLNHTSSRPWIL